MRTPATGDFEKTVNDVSEFILDLENRSYNKGLQDAFDNAEIVKLDLIDTEYIIDPNSIFKLKKIN